MSRISGFLFFVLCLIKNYCRSIERVWRVSHLYNFQRRLEYSSSLFFYILLSTASNRGPVGRRRKNMSKPFNFINISLKSLSLKAVCYYVNFNIHLYFKEAIKCLTLTKESRPPHTHIVTWRDKFHNNKKCVD